MTENIKPKHIAMTSLDGKRVAIEALAKIIPSCFTETKGEDGEVHRIVDFNKLRLLLGDQTVEDAPEVYDFTWVGKRAALKEAAAPINKTLRPCPEESVDWDSTQNLYIEGDNLEVLKLLQNSYMGKVKMIYIDPPYNTGNDFVYHDDFAQSAEEYDESNRDEEGNRFRKNTDSNGRFHSDWCSMIFSRLMVCRSFLKEDGVIFISIDEHEINTLKTICNEVFNELNFIGTLVIQTATDNNPGQIKMQHEYILSYAKNRKNLRNWAIGSEKAKLIQEKYLELKGQYKTPEEIQDVLRAWIKVNKDVLKGVTHYDNVDERGVFHDGDIANTVFGGYEYDIIHPVTGKVCKMPEKGYRFPEGTMKQMLKDNDVMFGVDETTLPKPKIRIEEAKDLLRSVIYEDGRSSTKKFEALMARDIFQNPKSENILSHLVEYIVEPEDIIMDFFSGSATTAEATFLAALKIHNLKFIMVQYPENLDDSLKSSTSKAKKTINNAIKFLDSIGKKHTIPEIGKERIRRAGKKIKDDLQSKAKSLESTIDKMLHATPDNTVRMLLKEQQKEIAEKIYKEQIVPKQKELDAINRTIENLDIGFRVFKCEDSNYKEVAFAPKDYTQDMLAGLLDNIKEDRTDLDLLFDCMLRWGVELSMPLSSQKVDGCTIHNVNDGDLVACFDGNVTEKVIDAIAELSPVRVVFRDSSFNEAANKMNLFELFKQKCDWSDEEVRNNVRVI